MMEPVDPSTLGPLPAPFWFIQFFKVLGFILHMVPMNLWFAGMFLTLVLYRREGHPRQWAERLATLMPVIIAFGVNFGIVPLLFIQVAYPWAFYPATILTAWFWLAIIGLLLVAYYGVYAFAFGVKPDRPMPAWRYAAGWVAAVFFLIIAILFSNGMSLMAAPERWKAIWLAHQVAGAATGTGHNFADSSLWHRWPMVLGMAFLTTAAWSVIDGIFFDPKADARYRQWLAKFAFVIGIIGAVIYVGSGTGYVFGSWPKEVFQYMWSGWRLPLTILTGASPALVLIVLFIIWSRGLSPLTAVLAGVAQLVVIALNAVSRQIVQNIELAHYAPVWKIPEKPDWGPMALFLGTFAVGTLVLVWMLQQLVRVHRGHPTVQES